MTRSKIQNLDLISLQIEAGRTPDTMDIAPSPVEYDFIYGLGPGGLTGFEFALADMQRGDSIQLNIQTHEIGRYFELNTAFHNVYLDLSTNNMLLSQVNIIRQRLFDFGAKGDWISKVRELNYTEHLKLINLIEQGDAKRVAGYLRDVHMVINW